MEGVRVIGAGQGTCSGSLDCDSLTDARKSSTREGPHKRHHQIPPSCDCAVVLCPGGTAKSYKATQNWVYRLSLYFFIREWLLAAVCCLALPAPTELREAHASGVSPHFSLFLFLLTSYTAMRKTILGSSQPLCLFLPTPYHFSTLPGPPDGMVCLPWALCPSQIVEEREPSIISTYLVGKYRSLSSFLGKKKKEEVDSYSKSHSKIQAKALFFPLCLPPVLHSTVWKKMLPLVGWQSDVHNSSCEAQLAVGRCSLLYQQWKSDALQASTSEAVFNGKHCLLVTVGNEFKTVSDRTAKKPRLWLQVPAEIN